MAVNHPLTFRGLDEDATVRAILEGTATETGERFFAALVVGGNAMERSAGVPFALVDVIQGIIILLILARSYIFRGRIS